MLEKNDALERVVRSLSEKTPAGQSWIVLEKDTIETPFAWIFFYNSKEYVETGNVIHRLAGNGPVFVNKKTGEVQFYGSTPLLKNIVEAYEKALR